MAGLSTILRFFRHKPTPSPVAPRPAFYLYYIGNAAGQWCMVDPLQFHELMRKAEARMFDARFKVREVEV